MFWRFGLSRVSKIDTILMRPDFTLEEVLSEEDVLQECKADNRKLVDYISSNEVMEHLLDYVTKEPPAGVDEKIRFKFPSIASEVLSSDSNTINDALWAPAHIQRVWGILDSSDPLHPLIGSFFLKLINSLLAKKGEEMVEYIRLRPFLIERLLFHLETPAITDVVTSIAMAEGSKAEPSFQEFLCETAHLVDHIIELFAPASNSSYEKICNAAQVLQDIVFTYRKEIASPSAPSDPDATENTSILKPLYSYLLGEATVNKLLTSILSLQHRRLERGLQCLHDLLSLPPRGEEEPPYRPEDIARHLADVTPVLNVVALHVADLHAILLQQPAVPTIVTASGPIGAPLGSTRVKTVKLLQFLMASSNESVFAELRRLGTLRTCLDFFFRFSDNNFVQKHVADMITTIITPPGGSHPLYEHLFKDCQLLMLVLAGWSASVESEVAKRGTRKGYIGHLAVIATALADLPAGPRSPAALSEEEVRQEWEQFVANELHAHQTLITREIGGPKPMRPSSPATSEDDQGGQDIAAAQAEYMRYLQQHSYGTSLPDDFGFTDDADPESIATQYGTSGDFGDKDEFAIDPQEWTSDAASATRDWQIADGLHGADPAMPEDEWAERQIEDQSGRRHNSDSDSDDDHNEEAGEDDSDSDSEGLFQATRAQQQALDVPLSPRAALAVAQMPTQDPFASPRVRTRLNLDDEDAENQTEQASWANFDDEPQAMDVQPATLTAEQYDSVIEQQLAEPVPSVGPLKIGEAEEVAERLAAKTANRPLPETPFAINDEQLLTAEQEAADEAAAAAAFAAAVPSVVSVTVVDVLDTPPTAATPAELPAASEAAAAASAVDASAAPMEATTESAEATDA